MTEQNTSAENAEDHHLVRVPEALEVLGDDLKKNKVLDPQMFAGAIGGWKGVVDSSLPSAAFVLVYLFNGNVLMPAIWVAVITGVIIAVFRIFRRESTQQVLSGFLGVALSAYIATRTDSAVGFFLPTILFGSAYGLAFLISGLLRWPLIGLIVGTVLGNFTSWRQDPELRTACVRANWLWVLMYAGKLTIQLPLYFFDLPGLLGISKIALGYPPMILVGWLTYRMVKGPVARFKSNEDKLFS